MLVIECISEIEQETERVYSVVVCSFGPIWFSSNGGKRVEQSVVSKYRVGIGYKSSGHTAMITGTGSISEKSFLPQSHHPTSERNPSGHQRVFRS
jgi:hypothetical protein